jgi:peptide/nickel transport system permease protein
VPPPGSWPVGCRFAARCRFAQEQCTVPFVALPAHGAGQDINGSVRCIRVEELARADVTWGADDVGAEIVVGADPIEPVDESVPTAGVPS